MLHEHDVGRDCVRRLREVSEADDADMDNQFTQVEQERDLIGLHERYDAEVARWEEELK